MRGTRTRAGAASGTPTRSPAARRHSVAAVLLLQSLGRVARHECRAGNLRSGPTNSKSSSRPITARWATEQQIGAVLDLCRITFARNPPSRLRRRVAWRGPSVCPSSEERIRWRSKSTIERKTRRPVEDAVLEMQKPAIEHEDSPWYRSTMLLPAAPASPLLAQAGERRERRAADDRGGKQRAQQAEGHGAA